MALTLSLICKHVPSVVKTVYCAVNGVNHYAVDKYYGNQLLCPLDRDLSRGYW